MIWMSVYSKFQVSTTESMPSIRHIQQMVGTGFGCPARQRLGQTGPEGRDAVYKNGFPNSVKPINVTPELEFSEGRGVIPHFPDDRRSYLTEQQLILEYQLPHNPTTACWKKAYCDGPPFFVIQEIKGTSPLG